MKKTIIIAEAGVNHNGSVNLAKDLALVAKKCGADYIKYQTFITEKTISKKAKKAKYQISMPSDNQSQFEMVKNLELKFKDFIEIKKYCDQIGIGFLSSAFDTESLDFLQSLDLDFHKIASGEITNRFILEKIAGFNKKVLLSTGMSSFEEINDALNVLIKGGLGKEKIILMHCNTEYPTPLGDVNLKVIKALKNKFGVRIGYSDHTIGIEIALASVLYGSSVIEKHFTLNKDFEGPDHKMSLDQDELFNLVNSVRNIEEAISGDGIKTPSKSEEKNTLHIRKSLYYSRNLKKGEKLKKNNLIALRPASGVSPMKYKSLIGMKLARDVNENEILSMNDFKN